MNYTAHTLQTESHIAEFHLSGPWSSGSAWPLRKIVEKSRKISCLEMGGNRIKCSTVLWLLNIQVRRGRKV